MENIRQTTISARQVEEKYRKEKINPASLAAYLLEVNIDAISHSVYSEFMELVRILTDKELAAMVYKSIIDADTVEMSVEDIYELLAQSSWDTSEDLTVEPVGRLS
ncbi:MAG TPA: hypothetical protein VD999_05140 [Vitreimonas sp.]|nr:hypothetical protein [Vitreimonas sp.]